MGIMKVSPATLIEIWWAARAVTPNLPIIRATTVNIKVSFTQYDVGTRTVNCHPKAVQVLSLAERKETVTGFKAVEGYGSSDDDPTSGFTAVGEGPVKQEASNDDFDDEPEEPKKVAKKEKPSPKVKDDDDDLNAIIDEWGDD